MGSMHEWLNYDRDMTFSYSFHQWNQLILVAEKHSSVMGMVKNEMYQKYCNKITVYITTLQKMQTPINVVSCARQL